MGYYKASIENGGMRDFSVLVSAESMITADVLAKIYFRTSGFDTDRNTKTELFDISTLTIENCDKIFDCDYVIELGNKPVIMLEDIAIDKSQDIEAER